MVAQLTGKQVKPHNRYLLVVDSSRACWVRCLDLDGKAKEMLEAL